MRDELMSEPSTFLVQPIERSEIIQFDILTDAIYIDEICVK